MKHLPTSDFLRDLARRVDGDYDRGRLESIADVIDGMGAAEKARIERATPPAPGSTMVLAGATITHRPDVAYAETALRKADTACHGGFAGHRPASVQEEQAAMQGDADRSGHSPAQRAMLDRVGKDAAAEVVQLETIRVMDGVLGSGGGLTPVGGRTTHVIPGNAGTIQAPAPLHAAEQAKVGTETR